jgi:hypothetical protein
MKALSAAANNGLTEKWVCVWIDPLSRYLRILWERVLKTGYVFHYKVSYEEKA